jgi:hypothetical protein
MMAAELGLNGGGRRRCWPGNNNRKIWVFGFPAVLFFAGPKSGIV